MKKRGSRRGNQKLVAIENPIPSFGIEKPAFMTFLDDGTPFEWFCTNCKKRLAYKAGPIINLYFFRWSEKKELFVMSAANRAFSRKEKERAKASLEGRRGIFEKDESGQTRWREILNEESVRLSKSSVISLEDLPKRILCPCLTVSILLNARRPEPKKHQLISSTTLVEGTK